MANDFTNDANCKALWKHDNGALSTDSIDINFLGNNGVTADTGDFKEGDASGVYLNNVWQEVTDSNLGTGFPMKSGDTNKQISLCCWFQVNNTAGSNHYLLSKWDTTLGFSFYMAYSDFFEDMLMAIRYGGSNTETFRETNMAVVDDRWYHVGFTFDDGTGAWRIRIYDSVADNALETTGTASNKIDITTAMVQLGGSEDTNNSLEGKLDEVVVFNDILTADEIDEIRAGTYAPTGPISSSEGYRARYSGGSRRSRY